MGTVSLKFVFSGAITISTWTLTGLVFEAFTMEQLLRSSKRYSPIRPSIPIFKSGAYLLELFKKSLHHRKSFEHKPCLISSQNYTCAAKNKHLGNSRCCFHLHRPHSWRFVPKKYDKKYKCIVTKHFCNCTEEALWATLVDATGTVWLLVPVWSEWSEMRIRAFITIACAVALLLSTWRQNEQRNETVFELGTNTIEFSRRIEHD